MSRNRFSPDYDPGPRNPAQRRSPKQEKSVAHKFGFKQTPQSGAGRIKGDVHGRDIARIECKTTSHASYSLKIADIEKIEQAGIGFNEIPAMIIEFLDERGEPLKEVAVIETRHLQELFKRASGI